MSEEKARVRDILRKRKDAMTPEERAEKSGLIARHLMLLIAEGETVMVFTSKEKEVNTRPLIEALFEQKNPVIVPIIPERRLSASGSRTSATCPVLVPSTFGVPEPIGNEIPAKPQDVDTIILPMLGFDRAGGRIGYGAGYYDRFLEKNPGPHEDRHCIWLSGNGRASDRSKRCPDGPDRDRRRGCIRWQWETPWSLTE